MNMMEKMPEGNDKEKEEKVFNFDNYDVVVRKNNLVKEKEEANELKIILQYALNAEDLVIKDKEGKAITGGEFDKIREKLWEDENLVSVLTHNNLSFSKVGGVGFVIDNLIKEKGGPAVEAVKKDFDELTKSVDVRTYKEMSAEEKNKFMGKLDRLGLKLYGLCP